jgi:8-oxo-dGTP pyrophosphatase MutT (NUDIX family)
MGAGVIPVSIRSGEVLFLFQKTFSGRKAGYLVDFGGGMGDNEDFRMTAVREFVEETETMYFADDLGSANRSEDRVNRQIGMVDALFEHTLAKYPHWWRRRIRENPGKVGKEWRSYFIEFPYRDITALNREWESDTSGRFKKRRELVWVSADSLLDIYQHTPQDLWKRVRQLDNVQQLIWEIGNCVTQA